MALVKLTPTIRREILPPVRMWLDDLKELEVLAKAALRDGSSHLRIRASTAEDEYQLASIDDLRELDHIRVKWLSIRSDDSKFELNLDKWPTVVTATDPSPEVHAIVSELARIIRLKARRSGLILDWLVRNMGLVLILTVVLGGYILATNIHAVVTAPPEDGLGWRWSWDAFASLAFGIVGYA